MAESADAHRVVTVVWAQEKATGKVQVEAGDDSTREALVGLEFSFGVPSTVHAQRLHYWK